MTFRPPSPTAGPTRIVVHDYSGHPFQVQLSRELARRGFDVLHLHCPSYLSGKGSLERRDDDPPTFSADAVDLGEPFQKYSPAKRARQERRYGRLCGDRIARFGPDVLLSSNTPLLAQRSLLRWAGRSGVRFVFWQQDIYSAGMAQAARQRLPLVGRPAGELFTRFEASMVRASDAVVVISEDFLPVLRRWGVPEERTTVVENWAPLDELPPQPRDNAWARQHGLVDRTVLLYSGTLGLKHNPDLLLQLARRFRDDPGVAVVVISEGRGAEWLRERTAGDPLPNLIQLPFQPYERLPEVLSTADVLLAILEPEAGVFSVPSKVLSYHCVGRALLAAMPAENLAARIIERQPSGLVTDPGDGAAFVAAAEQLIDDPGLRAKLGANARRYATETFDIGTVADRFAEVLVPSPPLLTTITRER